MKSGSRILLALVVTAFMAALPASAGDLFDTIFGNTKKKPAAKAAAGGMAHNFKFVIYLTTGDILKAIEYKGGSSSRKGAFRFISNFESDIEVKTGYIKFIDMDMIGDQPLDEEYMASKSDRVYLRNQDYLTGKVVGFTAKDVLVSTSYGDLKADVAQVRYVMFRNPTTSPEPAKATPAKAPMSSAPPAPAEPSAPPAPSGDEK